MSNEETKPADSPEPAAASGDALPDRKVWLAPTLEELDLRDAMGAGAVGTFDGVSGSS